MCKEDFYVGPSEEEALPFRDEWDDAMEGWGDDEDYYYEDDGQPDEMQEWHDFDPEC